MVLDRETKRKLFDFTIKKQIREHYDKEAITYDSENLIDRRPESDYVLWHYLRIALGTGHNTVVLDVGGGTGRDAITLMNNGHEAVLADISRQMIAQAR